LTTGTRLIWLRVSKLITNPVSAETQYNPMTALLCSDPDMILLSGTKYHGLMEFVTQHKMEQQTAMEELALQHTQKMRNQLSILLQLVQVRAQTVHLT
jgi:hypothetical protein